MPSAPATPSRRATGAAVSPYRTTVAKMATKTTGRMASAPAIPFCSSWSPNADAEAPATMPRGAIHATNARSRSGSGERHVASATAAGRMTSTMTATSASASGRTASTSAGDTDAAIRTKSTPTSSCTRVCWNSSISETSIARWLASAMPIAVVATNPESSRIRSAATSAPTTVASVTGTACRGARRCASARRNRSTHDADGRDEQPGADAQQHLARVPRLARDGGVEDQHAEQRADRIDEHALPGEQ